MDNKIESENIENENKDFRSGFITIVGRPNVGKSTLLNAIVGEKITAVSPKPNMTRNRILGIKNFPGSQLIFIDTPGIHRARGALNKAMVQIAMDSLSEVDLTLLVIEAKKAFTEADMKIINILPDPTVLVINKIDNIQKPDLFGVMARSQKYADKFVEVVPISATKNDGIDILIETIEKRLPHGPKYFPEDMITDQPERFIVAELIREKVFNLTHEEIPYKTAVLVQEFIELPEENLIRIMAEIYVERKSHKGIVIGKKGEMLKNVGSQARVEIESLLNSKVYLELWVKVKEKWTSRKHLITEYVYGMK